MEIIPILNAMKRNKVGALLIGLQIAITLSIVTNAMFIIESRSILMDRPSGVDEENTFFFSMSGVAEDYDVVGELRNDLDMIRAMPGIIEISTVNSVPLANSGSSNTYAIEPMTNESTIIHSATYSFDENFIDALGLNLIEGVTFEESDVNYLGDGESRTFTKIIVTKAFAEQAFGKGLPTYIGKHIYRGDDKPLTIIGVLERLQVPWPSVPWAEVSVVIPLKHQSTFHRYAVRTEPGKLEQLMPQVVEALRTRNTQRIILDSRSFLTLRAETYENDSAMSTILSTTVIVLFVITSLGIVGLASFTVNRRKKQIGTRRALGARKKDIVRYFLTENLLITTMGLFIGAMLTYLLNFWLVETYSMTKISWYYVPIGMIVLLLLGQIAVYMPARKAASISPAMATRSV